MTFCTAHGYFVNKFLKNETLFWCIFSLCCSDFYFIFVLYFLCCELLVTCASGNPLTDGFIDRLID